MNLYKYNIINTVTLTELERAYEKAVYRSYSEDMNLNEAALLECPEIVLGLSDEYMAGMINTLSEKNRNIMVICGYGQTRSIPYYLYFSKQANAQDNL